MTRKPLLKLKLGRKRLPDHLRKRKIHLFLAPDVHEWLTASPEGASAAVAQLVRAAKSAK